MAKRKGPKRPPKLGPKLSPALKRQRKMESLGGGFAGEALATLMDPSVIAINLPPGLRERRTVRKRAGVLKRKITAEIQTEPVIAELKELELGRAPAIAIADEMRRRLEANSRPLASATTRFRRKALKAYGEGRDWAMQRYSGDRTPAAPPQPESLRYGVDSGRLADNLRAQLNKTDKSYTINVTRNRLNLTEWRGQESAFADWAQKFAQIVDLPSIMAVVSDKMDLVLMDKLYALKGQRRTKKWQRNVAVLRALGFRQTAGFVSAII